MPIGTERLPVSNRGFAAVGCARLRVWGDSRGPREAAKRLCDMLWAGSPNAKPRTGRGLTGSCSEVKLGRIAIGLTKGHLDASKRS